MPKDFTPDIDTITRKKLSNDMKLYEGRKQEAAADFNKLSWGTLRKYQYYFKLSDKEPAKGVHISRKDLLTRIEAHFNVSFLTSRTNLRLTPG